MVAILPADHIIKPEQDFTNALLTAMAYANDHNVLALLGLKPTYAATGYGYIEYKNDHKDLHAINHFHEKPLPAQAEQYITHADYALEYWYFLWNIIYIYCKNIKTHAHDLYQQNYAFYLRMILDMNNASKYIN